MAMAVAWSSGTMALRPALTSTGSAAGLTSTGSASSESPVASCAGTRDSSNRRRVRSVAHPLVSVRASSSVSPFHHQPRRIPKLPQTVRPLCTSSPAPPSSASSAITRGSFAEGTYPSRGSYSQGASSSHLTSASSPRTSGAQQPDSKRHVADTAGIPEETSYFQTAPISLAAPQSTQRRAVLLAPAVLTAAAALVAALGPAAEAASAEGLQQQWRPDQPIRQLKDNFGVAVLLATEESLIDTGRITRYDLQKEFFKLRQQEFAPLKKANFGGLRALGQELNVNDVPYFNFQSYIQWKLVSKKLRSNEDRKDFNLAVGRKLLVRYFPDLPAQVLSTCPDYRVASANQRAASSEGFTPVSANQGAAGREGYRAGLAPDSERSRTHSDASLFSRQQQTATVQYSTGLATNKERSSTYSPISSPQVALLGQEPQPAGGLIDGMWRADMWEEQEWAGKGVPMAYQGQQQQQGARATYVNMEGVPMADQIIDGTWRGDLWEERERADKGVCAKGVMSAVTSLLEKLKAINFVEDFTVKWWDVADGVPDAGQRGSATLFVKLKGPADLQGGQLIRAEADNFWQRIASSMLSALFEELGVETAVDEYFYRGTYKPKSLLEQAVLSLGDPLLPVIDVDVDEINETWRLSWA